MERRAQFEVPVELNTQGTGFPMCIETGLYAYLKLVKRMGNRKWLMENGYSILVNR